jgi:cell fate regulator YaaT (PSP1 superfamily)
VTTEILVGDFAVVETSRGRQLGQVVQIVEKPSPPPEGVWKPIHHRATPRDLVLRQLWQKKELEAMINCRAKLAEIKIPGVKVVAAEFSFDGSRLSFLYSTESESKVDLRRLQSAMQRLYIRSRVEMRQIGPRDVAKLLGGMGACGIDNRCCSMFLTEFSPISIKMAKEQGISLTPTEITGMCGRLRCCLIYEYEQYVEARKNLPKRGKRVVTPSGEGKVLDVYPLKQTILVELDNGVRVEVAHADVQPWEELEALRKKSQEPCGIHEGGACTCGKHTPAAQAEPEEEALQTPEAFQPKTQDMGPLPTRAAGQPGASQPGPGQPGYHKSRKVKRKNAGRSPWVGDGGSHGGQQRAQPGSQHPGRLRRRSRRSQNKPPRCRHAFEDLTGWRSRSPAIESMANVQEGSRSTKYEETEDWKVPQRILVILAHPDDPEFLQRRWRAGRTQDTAWCTGC